MSKYKLKGLGTIYVDGTLTKEERKALSTAIKKFKCAIVGVPDTLENALKPITAPKNDPGKTP